MPWEALGAQRGRALLGPWRGREEQTRRGSDEGFFRFSNSLRLLRRPRRNPLSPQRVRPPSCRRHRGGLRLNPPERRKPLATGCCARSERLCLRGLVDFEQGGGALASFCLPSGREFDCCERLFAARRPVSRRRLSSLAFFPSGCCRGGLSLGGWWREAAGWRLPRCRLPAKALSAGRLEDFVRSQRLLRSQAFLRLSPSLHLLEAQEGQRR